MEIAGTYVHDGLTYWITATADPSVVKAHVSHYSLRAHGIDVEMRKSSPTAWDGVLPPHAPGGAAPIHWEFEPGLGAFTSTSPGKPTRRFVRLTRAQLVISRIPRELLAFARLFLIVLGIVALAAVAALSMFLMF